MYKTYSQKIFAAIVLSALIMNSCNTVPNPSEKAQDTLIEETTNTNTQENNVVSSDSPSDELSENESTQILYQCPAPGSNLVLGFDHTLSIEAPETNLTHILQQGFLSLSITISEDIGDVAVASVTPEPLIYQITGIVGPCEVEADGTVSVSAHGYCEDGIVTLIITEDWGEANGTMLCDDTVMPYTLPAAGPIEHSGAFGLGEEFLLVEGEEGYSSMRPFLGGSGYHTWTLYVPDIQLVPLVP